MMLSRSSAVLRSSIGRRMLRQANPQMAHQRRPMGGGGAFMETNKFGERVGEVFGTIAWLWIFYRFSQDGKVLLGMEHPWDHGHHDDHAHGGGHGHVKKLSPDESKEQWDNVAASFIKPGEDDDDDEDDEDEDDDDE